MTDDRFDDRFDDGTGDGAGEWSPGSGGATWSRREVLRRGAVGGAALVGGLSLVGLAGTAPAGAAKAAAKVTVTLPDHPYFPGTAITPDAALLNRLAAQYAKRQGRAPLEMTRFLFGDVPVQCFDEIFRTKNPARTLPIGAYLWLFHLSGYFGGVWLRGELVRTGKNPTIAAFSTAQSQQAFTAQANRAAAVLADANGSDAAVLAYNRASLLDRPDPADPSRTITGLADTYGYNEGYLLQIVEKPPVGLTTPPKFVVCPTDPGTRPLYCQYATSQVTAVAKFDPVSRLLAKGKGEYGTLRDQIVPVQTKAITRGRQVWDTFLNVQGFAQSAYEQLLDISSAFLETVQATALSTVEAVAESDAALGRQAATANACMGIWLASYTTGLIDGRPDRAIPTFST
ncbi:MAG: hypothetical protein ACKOVH_12905 [Actinomycetota bacterium]